MANFWRHAFGVRPDDVAVPAEPFDCTLEEAQNWCNFVVLRPDWLPSGCEIQRVTVRAESAERASSLRMTVGGSGRAFRLKQFHMDWWVPTCSDANLTAPGRPFIAAGNVGYFGRDYKGREAACAHRYGALLELSVLEGRFTQDELQLFFDRLQPQSPETIEEIAALPFARVSFYARKGPGPGPWNYDLLAGCRWSSDQDAWKRHFGSRALYPRWLPDTFAFDSVGTREEPESRHWEYQLLFRCRENLSDNIWLRAIGEETQKVIWISPGLDRRMGVHLEEVQLANRCVRLGCTSEPYGERVAQWIENGLALEIHARASLRIRGEDFVHLLDSLAPIE